jgi:hypothetical protein
MLLLGVLAFFWSICLAVVLRVFALVIIMIFCGCVHRSRALSTTNSDEFKTDPVSMASALYSSQISSLMQALDAVKHQLAAIDVSVSALLQADRK